ncbi:MAG: Gfo/Idh/MocA family oxidoreductase [Rhizobiales bacterium]|nr:Gfo/Idh/MocA family oxidoreductase [Hyphomicrobiales bacterium]
MAELRPIRVGVVGLGYFGSHHVRHYAAHSGAELVAVVDVDPARAAAVAAANGAAPLADHRALIGKVDAVSVTVPTSEHHAVATELVEAGIHVFVEKPITVDVASAADLVTRAERRGMQIQVGHIERFAPAFRALRERVSAPRLIECVRRTPWSGRALDVDVVLDLMIHDIDLVLTLAASEVVSVEASGISVATPFNDVVEARVAFANGVVATLAVSRVAAAPERTLAVTEDGRRLMADLGRTELTIVSAAPGGIAEERVALTRADNLAAEVDAFITSVAAGTPPPVDGRAGLDALKLAEAILAAARGSRPARPRPMESRV